MGVKSFLILWSCQAQCVSPRQFCRGWEVGPGYIVKCSACLIFSKCYLAPYDWVHSHRKNAFRLTWPCLIIDLHATRQNFLNTLVTVQWSTAPLPFTQKIFWLHPCNYGALWTCKTKFIELDYVIDSSLQISNHIWRYLPV